MRSNNINYYFIFLEFTLLQILRLLMRACKSFFTILLVDVVKQELDGAIIRVNCLIVGFSA